MDKKKVMYIGIILLITVITSITYFSYAFFTKKDEYHGRLNIVAGELKYKLESTDLENNSITLPANTTKEIEIEITSLNSINSEYSLFYDNIEVEVGYKEDTTDLPSGSINSSGKKKVTLIIKNKTNSSQTITFGVKGGFSGKEVILLNDELAVNNSFNSCSYNVGDSFAFNYNGTNGIDGSVQEFEALCPGRYKLEVYGAQGGSYNNTYRGGYGGYATGEVNLDEGEILNVVVGGTPPSNTIIGRNSSATCNGQGQGGCGIINGGYNGGGNGYHRFDCSMEAGGGATHIAKKGGNYTLLSTYGNPTTAKDYVLIVGAGGGGGGYYSTTRYAVGGSGGGTTGGNGAWGSAPLNCEMIGYGGTQTAGGGYQVYSNHAYNSTTGLTPVATFGKGGDAYSGVGGNGGGAGWYGGRGTSCLGGGGGGSSYVDGLLDASTTAGQRAGNGYVKITYLGPNIIELIPKMTSNSTPSGLAIIGTSGIGDGSYPIFNAFDKDYTTNSTVIYDTTNPAETGWIGYKFDQPKVVDSYKLTYAPCATNHTTYTRGFSFLGSDDNENWTTLDTGTIVGIHDIGTISNTINNKKAYLYYKFTVDGPTCSYFWNNKTYYATYIRELEYFGY